MAPDDGTSDSSQQAPKTPLVSETPQLDQFLSTRDVHCPECRYSVRGVVGGTCPECGLMLGFSMFRGRRKSSVGWFALVGLAALLLMMWTFVLVQVNETTGVRSANAAALVIPATWIIILTTCLYRLVKRRKAMIQRGPDYLYGLVLKLYFVSSVLSIISLGATFILF